MKNDCVEVTLFGNPDQTLLEELKVDFGKISEAIWQRNLKRRIMR